MIYSPIFAGLPSELKQRIYQRLREALGLEESDKEFAYLPIPEKKAIRDILKDTLADLPSGW